MVTVHALVASATAVTAASATVAVQAVHGATAGRFLTAPWRTEHAAVGPAGLCGSDVGGTKAPAALAQAPTQGVPVALIFGVETACVGTVGVRTVGVKTVGVETVGVATVGVATVGMPEVKVGGGKALMEDAVLVLLVTAAMLDNAAGPAETAVAAALDATAGGMNARWRTSMKSNVVLMPGRFGILCFRLQMSIRHRSGSTCRVRYRRTAFGDLLHRMTELLHELTAELSELSAKLFVLGCI